MSDLPQKKEIISYEKFRKITLEAAREKHGDLRVLSEDEFGRLVQEGHVLASRMSSQLENLVTEMRTPEEVPGREELAPVVIEIAAVVIGVVAGDVAGTIASKRFDVAPAPPPSLTENPRRKD